jgi:hypothetical protein
MRITVLTAFCIHCDRFRHLFCLAREPAEFPCSWCGAEALPPFFVRSYTFFASEEDEFAEAQIASMECCAPAPARDPALAEALLDEKFATGGTCAICLEDFRADEGGFGLRNCGHKFHRECIARWLREGAAACPVCKAPV